MTSKYLSFDFPTLSLFLASQKTYNVVGISFLAVVTFLGSILYLLDRSRLPKIDLPGPTGWPFIGVALALPERPRKMLGEYRKRYGDAFQVRLGWYNWVIINTPEGVTEVFDRQVCIYNFSF